MLIASSQSLSGLLKLVALSVDSGGLFIEGLVIEPSLRWSDVVSLTHLEVLTEVLVTAPPVKMDHTESLVSSDLMRVRVSEVVLDTVNWESAISVSHGVPLVGLTNTVSPVLHHSLLSVLLSNIEEERAEEVETNKEVHESKSVLLVEWLHLPVGIADWVLVEPSDVLIGSPSLSIVSWLVHLVNKLGEVSISLLGQGTNKTLAKVKLSPKSKLSSLTVRSCQLSR